MIKEAVIAKLNLLDTDLFNCHLCYVINCKLFAVLPSLLHCQLNVFDAQVSCPFAQTNTELI